MPLIKTGMKKFDDKSVEFTTREKLAVIRMMEKIAKSNEQIMPEEMDYMVKMVNYLGMTSEDVYKAKELNLKDVGTIFTRMTEAKKKVLSNTIIDIAMADGHVDPSEIKVVLDTFLSVKIPTDNNTIHTEDQTD